MQTKICVQCQVEKPISDFCKEAGHRFGIRETCKKCRKLYFTTYRKTHRKKHRASDKKYRKLNKEKRNTYNRAYYYAHKKELVIKRKQKRKANPKLKLNGNMSTGIRRSLRSRKAGIPWLKLVNYTIETLKKHLERQFTEGMAWDNYGEWHIDHKIPVSVFNFTKPEHRDFKRCWALKNLQPMWAKKNIIKSNKINAHFQPSLLF